MFVLSFFVLEAGEGLITWPPASRASCKSVWPEKKVETRTIHIPDPLAKRISAFSSVKQFVRLDYFFPFFVSQERSGEEKKQC